MNKPLFLTGLISILNFVALSQQKRELYSLKNSKGEDPSQTVLDFDGVDDFIDLDNLAINLAGLSNYTIEFWMKADLNDQTSSIRTSLFSINPITSNGNGLLILLGGTNTQEGKIMVYDENTWGTNAEILSSQVVGDNDCHHIAYARNNGFANLYIDGVLAGSHNTAYTISSTDKISLGQEWDDLNGNPSTSQFYNGEMSDVRIWNYSKNQSEIQSDMNIVLMGSETGLIAYYKCNQGYAGANNSTETSLIDSSPNSVNGTLIDFTLNGQNSNWITKTCQPVGLNEVNALISCEFYPNPVSTDLHLKTSIDFLEEISFEVFDVSGKMIHQGIFYQNTTLDVSNYSAGLYYIQLKSGDAQTLIKIEVK